VYEVGVYFIKLVLLSEPSQLRLHNSYYKVRSVYYSLLSFGLIQSGPFRVLKSASAKKLDVIKPPRCDAQMLVTRVVTRCATCASKFLQLDCLISKYEWTPSRVMICELACAALASATLY